MQLECVVDRMPCFMPQNAHTPGLAPAFYFEHLLAFQSLQQLCPVAHDQPRLHRRVRGPECGEQVRNEVLGSGHRTEVKRAANLAAEFVQLVAQRRESTEHGLGRASHRLPFRREPERPTDEFHESMPDATLELTHLRADRGLGQAQSRAGSTEPALGAYGEEYLQLPQREMKPALCQGWDRLFRCVHLAIISVHL